MRLLQEQSLSPSRLIAGTAQSSSVNEFLDSSAKNCSGGTLDKFAAQLTSVVRNICSNLRMEISSVQKLHQTFISPGKKKKNDSCCLDIFSFNYLPVPQSSRQMNENEAGKLS